ncbi:YceI family protein [Roseovarius salinarum]|uniref:YceI family protein n=1 Tax=Roseovarius salinarum TaxID=1981892 RepID=UPI000C33A448|nr:YceI family protein [Roseovarius salinarum]
MLRLCLLALVLHLAAAAAGAAPVRYALDPARSHVGFTYATGDSTHDGEMPVDSAELRLDLDNLPASRIRVVLDARRARTGFFVATRILKGPRMLDVANHPEVRFRSTRITGRPGAAQVRGRLTVRGVTRPVTLRARIYRQRGTAPGQRDHLLLQLEGTISRAAFGATAFPRLVDDRVGLNVRAVIDRAATP